jgi:hypothetical protein
MLLKPLSSFKFMKIDLPALNSINQLFLQIKNFSIKEKIKIQRSSFQLTTFPILTPSYYTTPINERAMPENLLQIDALLPNSEIIVSLTSPLGSPFVYSSAISYASLSVFKAIHVVKISIHRKPHSHDYQFKFHKRKTKIRTLYEGKQKSIFQVILQNY